MFSSPILKWVGGKRQILPSLLARLPGEIRGTYREPFFGGGALFFALSDRLRAAVLSDINPDLIETYTAVRDRVDAVIAALQEHRNDSEHYYRIRAMDGDALSSVERAARVIFLNRCGYNGLYRVNASGKFNVPFGRYRNPTICDEKGLRAASRALQKAELKLCDFEAASLETREGDVVYFDPPYVPLSSTSSFTAYTKSKFGPEAQRRLRDTALELKRRGAHVLLSNSSAPFVKELYGDDFLWAEVDANRNINCKAEGRGAVAELLIW